MSAPYLTKDCARVTALNFAGDDSDEVLVVKVLLVCAPSVLVLVVSMYI